MTKWDCKRYLGAMVSEPGEAEMDPKTMSVPAAGRRYFDIGKNAAYDAVKRGEIPVIKIGRLLRVPIVALERMLEQAGSESAGLPSEHLVARGIGALL